MEFRQRLFQYRSYAPFPFLILMIIFAKPTIVSFIIGMCVSASGEFLRLWGVAIAGSETRTTGPVGGTFLITKGPFSYVRNPLYVGNILLYVGFGIMSNALTPWLPATAFVYFALQYSLIISLEEEYLVKTFGDEYRRYSTEVPRFVPTIRKFSHGNNPQPDLDWKRGMVSEKRTLQAISLLTFVLLVLWQLRG